MSNESSDAFKIRRAHRPERLAGTRELGGVLEPTKSAGLQQAVRSRLVEGRRLAQTILPLVLVEGILGHQADLR